MMDRRSRLVSLAQAMLDGQLSFFEGAVQVLGVKERLGGIADRDPDFNIFVVIQSETDHLPLKAQRSLWASTALAELEPEFRRIEEWAKSFAPQACRNLIVRYAAGSSVTLLRTAMETWIDGKKIQSESAFHRELATALSVEAVYGCQRRLQLN